MKRPTEQQVEIARSWLEHNEGEQEEREACRAVAEWLGHQEQKRMLRQEARKAGVPMSRLRQAMKSRG